MFTDYKKCKEKVLAEYDKYTAMVREIEDCIRKADLEKSQVGFSETVKRINKSVADIRTDRFRIMIAGEAKSGKSTFINAYLGVDLLPMDVKQCTSSIVEIKYGEQFRLKATYAGGKTEELTEEATIKNFLKSNAALNDEYRDIPVPTINQNLLVKFGKLGKDIPNTEITAFLENEQIKNANIHHISNYNEKIKSFISSHKAAWREIVVKIEIMFPFEDEALKGIEIIDSPGVCARGGVEDFTADYIENANAIIFLKPISGQALESSQFNEFMRNKSVERNKNALFLVLTRSTNVTPSEKERLREEAYKQFGRLPRQNILIVDSKAEIYANNFSACADFSEIKVKINALKESKQLDDFVQADRGEADGDKVEFIRLLRKRSNFSAVDEALSTFGHKAHYIIMSELLDNILNVYGKYLDFLKENTGYLKDKAEDPTKLAVKIEEIKAELAVIQHKMYTGIDEVIAEFTGEEGAVKKTADKEAADYKKNVAEIDANSSDAFEELQRLASQKVNKFKSLQASLQKDLVKRFNEKLVQLTNDSNVPYSSLEVDFSEETFETIKKSTKGAADEVHSYETGGCFSKTVTYTKYNQSKHFGIVKNKIDLNVDKIKGMLTANLEDFANKIRSVYLEKLKGNAEAKKSELNKVMEAKLTAEQIMATIDSFGELIKSIEQNIDDVNSIKGGFDDYVQ